VVLANFTAPDRAANIPEFVNAPADAIEKINEQFLNDYSHVRAGFFAELSGDLDHGMAEYEKALAINPSCGPAHQRLGFLLYNFKHKPEEGLAHTTAALRVDPSNGFAHYDMGLALRDQGKLDPALVHLAQAVQLTPTNFNVLYNPAEMHCSLGEVLLAKARQNEAADVLTRAVGLDPKNARAHYYLALAQAAQGMLAQPLQHYSIACSLQPALDTVPELHYLLSVNYAKAGQPQEALKSAQKALELAEARHDANLAGMIKARMEDYRQASRSSPAVSPPAIQRQTNGTSR
jgi:tetratricopeptide (TPR) repeat protein